MTTVGSILCFVFGLAFGFRVNLTTIEENNMSFVCWQPSTDATSYQLIKNMLHNPHSSP